MSYERWCASPVGESPAPSRECSIVEEKCIHGRTLNEVRQLAERWHLSQSDVATLLRLHGERLEEKLSDDREGLLCAAGLGHVASDAASSSSTLPSTTATPALPSGPEAPCPEPDAPFSLSLGHHPNTSILEARASSLHRLAADSGTILDALESSTGGTIPLPNWVNGDAMRTTLKFYDALGPYDHTSDSAWHSITPSDEDRAWRSVEPTEDRALFDLIRVANYLASAVLLKQALTALGTRLRGQNAAELRKRFGLPDDLTEEQRLAAEAESVFTGEPGEVLPTIKRGTTGITGTTGVGDSELLVQALRTLETSALCVLKGVNAGMLSAVRQLLCRSDMQAALFTTIELAKDGGTPEAVRKRREADPLEPECGWHQVNDDLFVKSGVGLNMQIISPTALTPEEQAWLRHRVCDARLCVTEVGREPFPTGPSYTVKTVITKTETNNAGVVASTDLRYVLRFPANDLIVGSLSRRRREDVSALHYAARRGDSAMVAVLIQGEHEKRMPADLLWECAAIMVHDAHVHCLRTFLESLTSMGHDPDDGRKFAWLVKAIEGAQKLTRTAGAPHPSVAMLAFLLGDFLLGDVPMRAPVEHNIAQYTGQHSVIPVTLPLHAAASLGNLDMVTMLLDHGANAELRARDFVNVGTPLRFAERAGHLEVAQLLRMRMAPGAANA